MSARGYRPKSSQPKTYQPKLTTPIPKVVHAKPLPIPSLGTTSKTATSTTPKSQHTPSTWTITPYLRDELPW